MKIITIGASILALTGLNTAIASHQFNQTSPSQATVQLIADQDMDATNAASQENDMSNPADQNANPDMNQNPTRTMQNNNGNPATQADQPAVPTLTTPAEHPVPTQPAETNPDSQNSY